MSVHVMSRRLSWWLLSLVAVLIFCNAAEIVEAEDAPPEAMKVPLSLDPYDPCLGPSPAMTRRDWWLVWVDRENVTVYSDRSGREPRKDQELKFLEELLVLDEDHESRMLLVSRAKSRSTAREVPVVDEVVGWVEWDHLILSFSPIRNRQTRIARKAFIINDWRRFKPGMNPDDLEQLLVQVKAAPSNDATSLEPITGTVERVLTIYKYNSCDNSSPEWYLVSRTTRMTYGRVQDSIIGWIPAARAQPWDTRQALEPHPERRSKANVYNLAEDVSDPEAEALFGDPMSTEPEPADRWRYPVLEHREGHEAILVGWQGPIVAEGREKAVDNEEVGPRDAAAYEMMKHVNVIFVVDATKSMGPYLDAVSAALSQVMRDAKSRPYHSNMDLKFGAVLYRDLLDTNAEQTQIQLLTSSDSAVSHFLSQAREPSTARDTDYEEAVYKGLEDALSSVAVEDQTNVIILVGDAGNAHNRHGLTDRMREDIRIMAPRILVVHLNRPASNDRERMAIDAFEPDVQQVFSVVRAEQEALYDRLVVDETGENPIPRTDPTNLFEVGHNTEAIDEAGNRVRQTLGNILTLNSDMMNIFGAVVSGEREPGGSQTTVSLGHAHTPYEANAYVIEMIARQCGSPEMFELLVKRKVQIFDRGYVRMLDDGGHPLMRPVQLVSLDEIENTEKALNELFQPGHTPDRADFLEAWQAILAALIGERPTSVSDYFSMVDGIIFREDSALLSLSRDRILNMSEEQFDEIVGYAEEALERLNHLRTERPEIWFPNYNDMFAWIPMEEMP